MLINLFYELNPLIPGMAIPILLGALTYSSARKKAWRRTSLNALWGVLLLAWVTVLAASVWYVVAFLILLGNGIEKAEAQGLTNVLESSLGATCLIAVISLCIDRHMLFASRAKNFAELNARFQSRVIGNNKDEILRLCQKHTEKARKSVLFFCNSMSFLDGDRTYLKTLRKIKMRAIAKPPSEERDGLFRNLAVELGIEVKSFDKDPEIRGRLIDPETPQRTRLILVNKEVDAAGEFVYSARIYSREDGSTVIDMASALFDSLWDKK